MDDHVIAESKTEYEPRHYRIISIRTAERMMHVEDCLELARIRVDLWAYEKGAGATGHVDAYLEVDNARVLAHLLAAGSLPEPIEELGGGTVAGPLVARIFRAEEAQGTDNPIRIAITNGPGSRQPNGLISIAKGTEVEKIEILLSRMDARRLGLALADHLLAWAAHTYAARLAAGTWQPEASSTMEGNGVEPPSGEEPPTGEEPTEAPPAEEPPTEERPAHPTTRELAVILRDFGSDTVLFSGRPEVTRSDPTLRYENGKPVGDNEAEIEAYHAYVAAEKTVPTSVDALRAWLRRTARPRSG